MKRRGIYMFVVFVLVLVIGMTGKLLVWPGSTVTNAGGILGAFRHCSVQECLNVSRCNVGDGSIFRHYVYPFNSTSFSSTVVGYFEALARSPRATTDPALACLLIVPFEPCTYNLCDGREFHHDLEALPFWNGHGRNHVILDFSDFEYRYRWSRAIVMRSNSVVGSHRGGFDMSIPLFGWHQAADKVRNVSFCSRPLLAAFLGSTSHYKPFRMKLYDLHEDGGLPILLPTAGGNTSNITCEPELDRVVVFPTCQTDAEMGGRSCNSIRDEKALALRALDQREAYSTLLSQTRFGLVPEGAGVHSYRLSETMAFGAIPVVLADGFVLPFEEGVDWNSVAIRVPKALYLQTSSLLRAVSIRRAIHLQQQAVCVYQWLMSSSERVTTAAMAIIRHRIVTAEGGEEYESSGNCTSFDGLGDGHECTAIAEWLRSAMIRSFCEGERG